MGKAASATDGEVLTYSGTSDEWEGGSPSASITEPTDLERGIIGGDEWVSGGSYTIGESVVIDENKLYLLVGDGGSTTKPSTDTTHLIWKETSISALTKELPIVEKYTLPAKNIEPGKDQNWDISSYLDKTGYKVSNIDISVLTGVYYSSYVLPSILETKLYATNLNNQNAVNGYIPILKITYVKNIKEN